MKPLILAAPGDESAARALADRMDAELGAATVRSFPDGEVYVRIDTRVAGRALWRRLARVRRCCCRSCR